MNKRDVADELSTFEAEELLGRKARLVLHNDVQGHITGVVFRLFGRSYLFEWFYPEDNEMRSVEVTGSQLELLVD